MTRRDPRPGTPPRSSPRPALLAARQRHRPRGRPTPGWARACSTCSASAWAARAPRTPASRASAARARCCSTARLVCSCLVLAAGRRSTDHPHRRVAWPTSARPVRRAAGLRRRRRRAVRLLHARAGDGRARPARPAAPAPDDLAVREAISGNLCRCTGLRPHRGSRAGWPCGAGPSDPADRAMSGPTDHRRSTGRPAARRGLRPPGRRRHRGPTASPRCRGGSPSARDLFAEGMLWGHTLRSPHPAARIVAVDIGAGPAHRRACTPCSPPTTCPVPPTYGLESPDQPVLARDVVRYMGEPVAVVAADHPETARRAAAAIRVDYEPLAPLVDAAGGGRGRRHPPRRQRVPPPGASATATPTGDRRRRGRGHLRRRHAGPGAAGHRGGPGHPAADGGVDLFVCTQALHNDLDQVAACLGLPPDKVRIHLAGVGGAFGAREDVSLQIHAGPAGAAHRAAGEDGLQPRGVVLRPRAPPPGPHLDAATRAERDGTLVKVEARLLLDGGAYGLHVFRGGAPTRSCFAAGPYRVPNALVRGLGGAHQQPALWRHARLRRRADLLRPRGPDGPPGRRPRHRPGRAAAAQRAGAGRRRCITGQRDHRRGAGGRGHPRPAPAPPARRRPATGRPRWPGPGGTGRTTDCRRRVRRGIGLRRRLQEPRVRRGLRRLLRRPGCRLADGAGHHHLRRAEIGQGFVTLAQQIAREVLGVDEVVLAPADTSDRLGRLDLGQPPDVDVGRRGRPGRGRGRAPPTARAGGPGPRRRRPSRLVLVDGRVRIGRRRRRRPRRWPRSRRDRCSRRPSEYHHAPTHPLDDDGQGDAHLSPSPSPPTGPSSTSTPSSAWCAWSCSWPPPRTWAGSSTRCSCSARSRAASPRAWAWR